MPADRVTGHVSAAGDPITGEHGPGLTGSDDRGEQSAPGDRSVMAASFVGMFMVTLDAVVVNVALPAIGTDLGGGMTGLQWVVDGYTLAFAALLLSSGAIADRIGARRTFKIGLALFVAASAACGLAPNLTALVIARIVQGAAAAVMTPSSMALLRQTFPDPQLRARAVGVWAMGGAVASTSGPVLGGLLTTLDWRLIFIVNVPIGAGALILLRRGPNSPRRTVPFDWIGQFTAVAAMGALTFGATEAGADGITDPVVLVAFGIALTALVAFLVAQARGAHPMLPLELFRSRTFSVIVIVGFTFMACFYGMPFVMSLNLQQMQGLSALQTGLTFLPMMLVGAMLTPFSARFLGWFGSRTLIMSGLLVMTGGLLALALVPATTPVWALAALMLLVGFAGPTVMPPATAALLGAAAPEQAGAASGTFNTSRQVGGALAVAVFGALLAQPDSFGSGLRVSLLIATALALVTAVIAAAFWTGRAEDR